MIGKPRTGTGKDRAAAHVVDGRLILSLPRAARPVVWQMDLGQTKSSALEVRQSENGSEYILVLKTPRGEAIEIAPFAEKNDAMEGLMAVASAFENAHGRIRQDAANDGSFTHNPVPAAHAAHKKQHHGKWLAIVLGAFMVIALILLWSTPTAGPPGTQQPAGMDPQTNSGIPVPADSFLQNR